MWLFYMYLGSVTVQSLFLQQPQSGRHHTEGQAVLQVSLQVQGVYYSSLHIKDNTRITLG